MIIALIILDLILLATVVFFVRRQDIHGDLVTELTEERKIIQDLYEKTNEELQKSQTENQQTLGKMNRIAAQIEQELQKGGDLVGENFEALVRKIHQKLEKPIDDLQNKQNHIELLIKNVDLQKISLQKTMEKAQILLGFFKENIPYEEILARLEKKKFVDARAMLSKGIPSEKVADDLGLTHQEMRLVVHTNF